MTGRPDPAVNWSGSEQGEPGPDQSIERDLWVYGIRSFYGRKMLDKQANIDYHMLEIKGQSARAVFIGYYLLGEGLPRLKIRILHYSLEESGVFPEARTFW